MFSLTLRGTLRHWSYPAVMGILNATPDSFFSKSRVECWDAVCDRVEEMVSQGADFIDVGAYSTRPGGCMAVSEEEEISRLGMAMGALRSISRDIPVSIDTFRASVARIAIEEMGADIINDISGGTIDPEMFPTVAKLKVPYILMHMRGTPDTKQEHTYYENLLPEIMHELAEGFSKLHLLGVNDIIIDPGFGFSKTLEQNYMILKHLDLFRLFHAPLLVGMSRKSMITKLLHVPASEALQGTVAINMVALQRGASILRVHDVEPAVQAVKIHSQLI